MPPKRMTANPTKAPRHRPGIALADSDSSSESESPEVESSTESRIPIPPPKVTTAAHISSHLKNIDLDERHSVAVLEESAKAVERNKIKAIQEEGFVTESSEESEEDSGQEESFSEDSSEEELPRRILARPTFIRKENRNKIVENKIESQNYVTQSDRKERDKRATDEIIEEQIKKDLAAKVASNKYWDDDEEEEVEADDTDDIDPAAEYAAWKLRELKRIKREREEIEEKEKEREEIERRKNLTAEERKKEDDIYIANQKKEKESKKKMSYMQKYYHRGAFYKEEAETEGLLQRNIMGSKIQDEVDREILPKYLQQRDLTKIGKKGATKYRDLRTEDTGKWGQFEYKTSRESFIGPYYDERFKPDKDRSNSGATGANSLSITSRKTSNNNQEILQKPEELMDRVKHSKNNDYNSPRSKSPQPNGGVSEQHHLKRSISRDVSRNGSYKRLKVDSKKY